jgi:hypothetical protein
MSSPVRPILPQLEATASPRQPAALPDDLLKEILVRVASPADLARASTASVSFHRLITDPIFLRRYRSFHPPLVLGLVNEDDCSFEPAEAPHPGAPAGRAMARAADFSFDYVPRGRWDGWYPCEIYDGRVLLGCLCPDSDLEVVLPDLAVCDPLSRRYLLLPPIPDGQAYEQNLKHYDVRFAPSVDEDDETSFRVIMVMHCDQELVVTVFSSGSGSGSWSVSASTSWDSLRLSRPTKFSQELCYPSYAYNCLYWKMCLNNKLVKLNMNTKKFSTVDLLPVHEERIILIVEEGNVMLGMFSHHIYAKWSPARYYTSVQKEGKITNEWQLKNIIPMPIADCCIYFVCQPQRYIFLADYTSGCFTLDFKTMTFERVNTKCQDVQPYLGYPPSMSPRRI